MHISPAIVTASGEADNLATPSPWLNRFASLGPAFFTELAPQGMPAPTWLAQSAACAEQLGWPQDWWQREDWQSLQVFSGNTLWPGMQPMATVYSGHQFGVWAGQLGDGRAHLLGEVATPQGPMEIQLKGAGLTPYSRMGDGRAVLRSSIREFLCSEAMAGLGIPTTRALALTASRLPVRRESLETAAIVTRVAPSFIRFGHFEHFAHSDQHAELRRLADFFIQLHAPECQEAESPYAALLEKIAKQTARLMADWQAVGFCHGVMNTDNMSMLGLTLDYGPFGFMDGFDPGHVCNHSDHQGRYAFARQPNMAFWNLHALAQAFMPLMPGAPEAAGETLLQALEPYKTEFAEGLLSRMRAKLGLQMQQQDDRSLIDDWLKLMASSRADYTQSFRRLSALTPSEDPAQLRDLFIDREALGAWLQRYQARLQAENSRDAERAARMRAVNPAVVLRNHLAEVAIRQARAGDFSETERLLKVLQHPFDEPERPSDAALPPDWAQTLEVSCSS
ncbi:protein adenylyltransferase SelO [Paucibacter sp. Y2R2-4]|uniref:protein adenylyltransferase SelO n=1 Tax=Paucibacter sp. Y2R2-4 TaxID=2893553 RepID=UPI0021E36844|nr:YdiU family protein [Paucibacter sp. Y2R2-4]MCV2349243.1 YdiU family protein [Paucibacter sp. Y2R2-4]